MGSVCIEHEHPDQGVYRAMSQHTSIDPLRRPEVVRSISGMVRQMDVVATEATEFRHIVEQRQHPRFSFAQGTTACKLVSPNGETSAQLVLPRNLSAGGVSILKHGFVYEGSSVELVFTRRDGSRRKIDGVATWCRMVRGNLHETGIRFGKYVSPHVYCSREAMSQPFSKERHKIACQSSSAKKVGGMALCIAEDAEEAGYMASVLAQDGLVAEKALSLGQGLDRLRQNRYEMVVVDLDIDGVESETVLSRVRAEAARTTTVVGLTWSMPEETEAMAQTHRAIVVQKPVPSSIVEEIVQIGNGRSAA